MDTNSLNLEISLRELSQCAASLADTISAHPSHFSMTEALQQLDNAWLTFQAASSPLRETGPTISVQELPIYLQTRKPVAHFDQEIALFVLLPDSIRRELMSLLGNKSGHDGSPLYGVFGLALHYVRHGDSVNNALKRSMSVTIKDQSTSTLRAKLDAYIKTGDWLCLVNRAKAGKPWQKQNKVLRLG